jgi:TatA/E family protein of Tat protein translocase
MREFGNSPKPKTTLNPEPGIRNFSRVNPEPIWFRTFPIFTAMILSILLGFLGGLGGGEIFLIVVLILLLFGAKRIPDLARGLGKGIKEFKDAKNGTESEDSKK